MNDIILCFAIAVGFGLGLDAFYNKRNGSLALSISLFTLLVLILTVINRISIQ